LRDAAAAKRLLRKALADPSHPQPRVINTDQARIDGSAIPAVKEEGTLRRCCRHRPVQYLNYILEQDHRAIKRRVKAKQGFREFYAARRTIQGFDPMHMIRFRDSVVNIGSPMSKSRHGPGHFPVCQMW
jgi:transposase-like protein